MSELWDAALRARKQLRDCEQHLDRAKSRFHQAVYKLSLDGVPLRAIAEKLDVSFQRIHQIVTLCRRTFLSFGGRPEVGGACSFCGVPRSKRQMIASPAANCCQDCLLQARQVLSVGHETDASGLSSDSRTRCDFCSRRRVAAGNGQVHICEECVDLGEEVLGLRPSVV